MAELVAVVSGAGGGIGGACARALADGFGSVVCVDRDAQAAEGTVSAIEAAGGRASVVLADAGAEDFGQQVAGAIEGEVGVVVHAVAHEEHISAAQLSRESLQRSLDLGPVAAFELFRACLPRMSARASCIAIGSLHETTAFADCLGYNAAHGALGQVVRTLAHEWSAQRIRVNAVVPGWIATPGETALYGEEHLARAGALLPFGRFGTPDQVAAAVAFLASPAADYISGAFLKVDGALSASLARLPGVEH
ncbi:SDR family oxidoreductase [Kribbella sp. NPDC056861]|uniref:SDR family NAD(P)-dependent oxidoreductase n=1 Tax=Kribbella sp. NPDC056861 TaxID=3154857 RepID=UPI0034467DCE